MCSMNCNSATINISAALKNVEFKPLLYWNPSKVAVWSWQYYRVFFHQYTGLVSTRSCHTMASPSLSRTRHHNTLPTPSFLSCCGGCTSETKGERETHPSSFFRCGGCTSRKRDREKREIVQERCFSMEILRSSVIVAMGACPLQTSCTSMWDLNLIPYSWTHFEFPKKNPGPFPDRGRWVALLAHSRLNPTWRPLL